MGDTTFEHALFVFRFQFRVLALTLGTWIYISCIRVLWAARLCPTILVVSASLIF